MSYALSGDPSVTETPVSARSGNANGSPVAASMLSNPMAVGGAAVAVAALAGLAIYVSYKSRRVRRNRCRRSR